jgi:hypothetical protein
MGAAFDGQTLGYHELLPELELLLLGEVTSGDWGLGFTLLREAEDAMEAAIRTSPKYAANMWDNFKALKCLWESSMREIRN